MSAPRSSRQAVWLVAAVCVLVGTSCGNNGRSQSALSVTVKLGDGLKATCVRVFAVPKGGDERTSSGVVVQDQRELHVAIFRSAELDGTVQVGARGYVGEGCDNAAPNEESELVSAAFKDGEVGKVTVSLEAVPSALDADGDGWRASLHGGLDCDDAHATVHPGAVELCDDGLDNDCNAQKDCEEAFCENAVCDDGDPCTVGERCAQGACGQGTPETCTTPPSDCFSQPGTCEAAQGCVYPVRLGEACAGGTCRADGTCVDMTVESNCQNGADDDNNGLTDCADPDCDQQPCANSNVCIAGSVCMNQACTSGPAVACDQPPGDCFVTQGTCSNDAGCEYAPKSPGSPCSTGECRGDGGCGPAETGALCGNGQDDDGDGLVDCLDSSCQGAICDDDNACTAGETCQAQACTGGTAVTCTMPPQCFTGTGTCDMAQGCQYTPTPDAPCTNGFCDAAGACIAPFPYPPSNFNPLDYAPGQRGGPYTFDCGTSVFDSSPGAAQAFTNWCNQTPPQIFTVAQPNGGTAVVLPMKGLVIKNGNTLQVLGSRPVILAVYADATIESGTALLQAGAAKEVPGAGGNSSLCGAQGPGATGASGGRAGGGGGGGFGTAGASGGTGADNTLAGDGGIVTGGDTLVPLRGGCGGGQGGNSGGLGGGGGGGVQLSVAGVLTVNGHVSARGGGGRGATQSNSGGGGGGSGGAVLLEGNTVAFGANAIVSTNGGGGGEGKGPTGQGSFDGNDGADGYYVTAAAAAGGNGGTCRGGDGGNGAYWEAALNQLNGAAGGQQGQNCLFDTGAGGGGGGGAGRIRLNAGANGCTVTTGASFRGVLTSNGQGCP